MPTSIDPRDRPCYLLCFHNNFLVVYVVKKSFEIVLKARPRSWEKRCATKVNVAVKIGFVDGFVE